MAIATLALMMLFASSASAGERVSVRDAGGFDPAGRTVEFPDRFGWRSYEASFSFTLDDDRRLSSGSRLDIVIHRQGGGKWKYSCRASSDELTARVVVVAIESVVHRLVAGDDAPDPQALGEELTRLTMAYLTAP